MDKSKSGLVKLTFSGKDYHFRVSLEENNKIMKGKLNFELCNMKYIIKSDVIVISDKTYAAEFFAKAKALIEKKGVAVTWPSGC